MSEEHLHSKCGKLYIFGKRKTSCVRKYIVFHGYCKNIHLPVFSISSIFPIFASTVVPFCLIRNHLRMVWNKPTWFRRAFLEYETYSKVKDLKPARGGWILCVSIWDIKDIMLQYMCIHIVIKLLLHILLAKYHQD